MNSRTKRSVRKKRKAELYVFNGKTKMVLWVAGAVVTITGAVVGFNNMVPIVEPYMPATHMYVRDLTDSTSHILRDIQVEQAQGKIDATNDAVVKWKLERSKTQDPVTQNMIDQHIHDLGNLSERLADQLKTLKEIKARER